MATTQQRTQLAQTVGSSSATSILSSTQGAPVAIHTIFIANTSNSDTTFSIYHDLDGTTYTTATALFWETDIPAKSTLFIEGTGDKPIVYMDNASGNFAFKSGNGSGLTITLYGTVET